MRSGLFAKRLWLAPLVLLLLLSACGGDDDKNPTQPTDTTPPAAITTLATGAVTAHTVLLSWTAVGDDGTTGTAHQYDIRYSTANITAGNFASATAVSGEPTPTAVGTAQQMTVTGLTAETPYYFAMKVDDEKSNWSEISNIVTATTAVAGDESAPAAVNDLAAVALDENSIALTWTAPGDDGNTGTAAAYDIRYATTQLSNANWSTANQATGEPAPEAAGTVQHMTISGLDADQTYYFALKASDEVPNESAISNVPDAHTPASQANPPGLLVPDFPDTVCISSQDQFAQMAKLMAESQMAMVNAYATLASAFFAPLQGADWQHGGDCWTYDYSYAGCTAHYEVCQSGTSYIYTMTVDGSCYGETYDHWVQYRVNVDTAARTGTFYFYELNTTDIQAAWIWDWTADENSGTYTFYNGDPATAPIEATVEWARSADLNVYDVTYIVPESTKMVSHVVKQPCSGYLYTYQWDSSGAQWWRDTDITWNSDDTGYWDTYDQDGVLQEHHPW